MPKQETPKNTAEPKKTQIPVSPQKEKVKKPKVEKAPTKKRWWLKDLILALVNLSFLVFLMVLIGMLPKRAIEFRQLRNAYVIASAKSEIEIAELEIERSRQKADELINLFPDEAGLADFAKEMDKLKEQGLISSFSFASERAVRDQTGYFGVPIVIRFQASWSQIGQGLGQIEELPFVIRVVSIESSRIPEGNLVDFKYGGFLYVDESLAETR